MMTTRDDILRELKTFTGKPVLVEQKDKVWLVQVGNEMRFGADGLAVARSFNGTRHYLEKMRKSYGGTNES